MAESLNYNPEHSHIHPPFYVRPVWFSCDYSNYVLRDCKLWQVEGQYRFEVAEMCTVLEAFNMLRSTGYPVDIDFKSLQYTDIDLATWKPPYVND